MESNYRPHPKDGEGNIFTLFVSPHAPAGTAVRDGGRYASCVYAGGLSCIISQILVTFPTWFILQF